MTQTHRRLSVTCSIALAMSAALLAPGCAGRTEPQPRDAAPASADAAQTLDVPGRDAEPPAHRLVNIPAPPGVPEAAIKPREGDAVTRANLSLDQAIATLPKLDFLENPTPNTAAAEEPPLAAQRAYIAGREAWRSNRNFEAITQLQSALVLAPDDPHILRLLGQIFTESGNRVRGAFYLEKAVRQQPDDAESLFMLARHAYGQGDWPRAAVLLRRVETLLDPRRDDPALQPLVRFFMFTALEQQGFDAAAVEQGTAYLKMPARLLRSTRLVREMGLLQRQRALTLQSLGDALHRLNRPTAALRAYEQAAAQGSAELPSLPQRTVYTHLRLGRDEQALDEVLATLRRTGADAAPLAMVGYLKECGVSPAAMSDKLRAVYLEQDRPEPMALLIASLEGDAAADLLRAHLAQKPDDRRVLERLIAIDAAEGGRGLASAVLATADTIEAQPSVADAHVDALLEPTGASHAQRAADTLNAIDTMPAEGAHRPGVRLIRAHALVRQTQIDQAMQVLTGVTESAPQFWPARLTLAKLLVLQKQFAEAERALAPLADRTDAQVIGLRARVLAELGRSDEALDLLERMLADRPRDVSLLLDKAGLQAKLKRYADAERTLLDALNAQPQAERVYEALLNLYQGDDLPDSIGRYRRLLMRMDAAIPQSRVARFERAKLLMLSNDNDAALAEGLLRQLLLEEPNDVRVLDHLLELLERTSRRAEGITLLEEKLAANPDNPALLRVAMSHYELRVGDRGKALALYEKMLHRLPPSADRSIELAVVYLRGKQNDKAVEVLKPLTQEKLEKPSLVMGLLRQALGPERGEEYDALMEKMIASHRDDEPDLVLEWSSALTVRGQSERAEKLTLDLLKKHPDHPAANNSLGYTWADAGRNLERAKGMIQVAIDAEPDNAAYLDSMGWVLYKQGNFRDAVTWLQRARLAEGGDHAVILDHLGDALFRAARKDEAVAIWTMAQMRVRDQLIELDPELAGLPDRLKSKIAAARAGQQPAVAASPGADSKPAEPNGANEPAEPAPAVPAEPAR